MRFVFHCGCGFRKLQEHLSLKQILTLIFMNGKLQLNQLNSTCDTVCRCRWFDPLSLHLSDPLRALELQAYSLKPLLRRAMAYDSLERYKKAYVDYKTVLQLDTGVQAAHDSVHR